MYVEKDTTGKIIIQDISDIEAQLLDDSICAYLNLPIPTRNTEVDSVMRKLKIELNKHMTDAY